MVFNNLYYLIGRDFLMEAFCQIRKNGAPGVDAEGSFRTGQSTMTATHPQKKGF